METRSTLIATQPVTVTENVVSIPTYGPLGRDPWPNVFFKTQWFAPFYPLGRFEHPAGPRHERTWVAVTLENEYLRVAVLPELGGHVWEMFDKVAGEHLVYNNDVIKPTRIGFRRGWCALGMEFNFPVAHSLQSIDPLPYRIERGEDGSAAVVTWHRDRPRRIEMTLRLTLQPGRRDLRVRAEMFNPSPVRRPYDYWANVAISARPQTEYVYPTHWMQAHGGRKVHPWPIVDGEDLRFQPNFHKTISLFAHSAEPPFFGCWWSDTDTGLVHVGDPASCPGKKLFNWGRRAAAWQVAVTDKSGPYAELQAGRFSTQADYEWLWPGQTDVIEDAWYGYHRLGGLSHAGRDLAMHVRVDDTGPVGSVRVGLHSVADLRGATVVVTADERVVYREVLDLQPAAPIRREVELPEPARREVCVEVIDADGETAGKHSITIGEPSRPRKPRAPREKWENMFASLEGKGAAQRAGIGEAAELNNLWPRAAESYEAALQADPRCGEALLGLGFLSLRNADFERARQLSQTLMALDAARWRQAGAYLVGAAALLAGDGEQAVEMLTAARRHTKLGQMARLLLAAALARCGRKKEAVRTVRGLREPAASMPIAVWLKAALAGEPAAADPAGGWTIADDAELFDLASERAAWAMRLGMPEMGERIVDAMLERSEPLKREPLVWYLKAYLQHLQGEAEGAGRSLARAAELPLTATYPPAADWAGVLEWATASSPADIKPLAYLAPLEYWLGRHEQAIAHWRALVDRDGQADAGHHYGLAMALWEAGGDRPSAARILAAALKVQSLDERLYLALDDVLSEAQDVETRGYWLEQAREKIGRTDQVVDRTCHWLIGQQRWQEVIELIKGHRFGPSHGFYTRRRYWLLAHHQVALRCLQEGEYEQAYEYGVAGSRPPATLGEDDMAMQFASPVLLAAAQACERMGDRAQARDLLRQAVQIARAGHMHPPYTEIHRARVLMKLGKKQAAGKVLAEVLGEIEPRLEGNRPGMNVGHFHYLYALVLETQGQNEQAREHFERAAEMNMQWANLLGFGMQWGFN